MRQTRAFFVPDYYERFICKADTCRANCCHGWCITVSMQDYFNLLSVPCSKRLRDKLDVSLHVVKNADPQRYAQILPNWEGNCPLQQEDGLCGLQVECGEQMLSSTCRYYPRGIRTAFDDECCLSGSCEGVLETMFESMEPIRFRKKELSFDMELPQRSEQGCAADEDRSIQGAWFGVLQDRTDPLETRLMRLGHVAQALTRRNGDSVTGIIKEALATFEPEQALDDELLTGYGVQMEILQLMAGWSEGIRPLVYKALDVFGMSPEEMDSQKAIQAHARYLACKAHFEQAYPMWQVYFEHMLVNHILYQGYPYSQRHESVWDEYTAICALYASLRALTIGCLAESENMEDFVDVCAAAFKLFDHSGFDHNVMVFLRQIGLCDEKAMRVLCVC